MSHRVNWVILCNRFQLLPDLLSIESKEVILSVAHFSKVGLLDFDEFTKATQQIKAQNKRVIFLLDLIEKDLQIQSDLNQLPQWLSQVDAIRVHDPGLAKAVQERFPGLPLQLSLEGSSPNARSIIRWAKQLQPERLILSNQLPLTQIEALPVQDLPPLEIAVLGPLEVFYSPRALLADTDQPLSWQAISEDRPRQKNRLLQRSGGTVMYHSRDLFLLDQLERIKQAGVKWVKLSPSTANQCHLLQSCTTQEEFEFVKRKWPVKVTRGFFSANRTDRPLKRLLNQNLTPYVEAAVGRIIDGKKGLYLLIELTKELQFPAQLALINPEGQRVKFVLEKLESLDKIKFNDFAPPGVYLTDWLKGGLARSLLVSIE